MAEVPPARRDLITVTEGHQATLAWIGSAAGHQSFDALASLKHHIPVMLQIPRQRAKFRRLQADILIE